MSLLMFFDNAKAVARIVPEFRALENCKTIHEVRRTVQLVRSNIMIADEENYPGTSDLR